MVGAENRIGGTLSAPTLQQYGNLFEISAFAYLHENAALGIIANVVKKSDSEPTWRNWQTR